jgi:hypothetical protein
MRACNGSAKMSLFVILLLASAPSCIGQYNDPPLRLWNLDLLSDQLPKGLRITAFEIELAAGRFIEISNLPLGWTVTFSNNSASKSGVVGHANSDIFAMDEKAIQNLGLASTLDHQVVEIADISAIFTGSIKGAERRFPVSAYSFHFNERFMRRPLPKIR